MTELRLELSFSVLWVRETVASCRGELLLGFAIFHLIEIRDGKKGACGITLRDFGGPIASKARNQERNLGAERLRALEIRMSQDRQYNLLVR
jgi:hypothetical protein